MACKDTDKLCYSWIVEYDCWRMWTKFSELGSVDGVPVRVDYCKDGPDPVTDRKANGYRLLMFFMCKISEAANEASGTITQHDVTTQQTNLEAAIDILDRISHHFAGVVESKDVKDVKLCLRVHAVLMPLRRNDCDAAQAVFDRRWNEWKNREEIKEKDKLLAMINDSSPTKQVQTFNEVILRCQELLEKIMSTLSKPFLCMAAQSVCEKVEANNNARMQSSTSTAKQSQTESVKSPSSAKKSLTKSVELRPANSPVKRSVLEADKNCVVDDMPAEDEFERSDTEEAPNKESAASAMVSKTTTDVTICSESAAGPSTSASNEPYIELSSDPDNDNYWQPGGKRKKKRFTRKPWSDLEEELVYKGVQAHGVGNWAQIHANFLQNRSNVDIKDKWRTMLKQERLEDLAVQFGPLPFD